MTDLFVRGMWGLGDNIFSRPFIRAASHRYKLWLETPWPELFEDFDVRFVRGDRRLRTQMKNVNLQPATRWVVPPKGVLEIQLVYGHNELRYISVVKAIEQLLPLHEEPFIFDLPKMGKSPVKSKKPIAVVRPNTIRAEWCNEARNPLPWYISDIVKRVQSTHYVVAVGDVSNGHEWYDGNPPSYDQAFLAGELDVRQLLALVRDASIVIGGVGWIVPASIALGVRAFIVLGGQGMHNGPDKITDPRMDLSKLGFATPDRFCICSNMQHRCDKRITNPMGQFLQWAARVNFPLLTNSVAVA